MSKKKDKSIKWTRIPRSIYVAELEAVNLYSEASEAMINKYMQKHDASEEEEKHSWLKDHYNNWDQAMKEGMRKTAEIPKKYYDKYFDEYEDEGEK